MKRTDKKLYKQLTILLQGAAGAIAVPGALEPENLRARLADAGDPQPLRRKTLERRHFASLAAALLVLVAGLAAGRFWLWGSKPPVVAGTTPTAATGDAAAAPTANANSTETGTGASTEAATSGAAASSGNAQATAAQKSAGDDARVEKANTYQKSL